MKKAFLLFCIVFLAFFLRFYHVATTPPGLYIDEVSIGYNAYSILTTGKDEHGKVFPLVFEAFGEYKMPVYIYLTSLSLAIFGKNDFAIRMPSVIFGTLTALILYFFAKELISYEKRFSKMRQEAFALLSATLLAISPWHIQFSRGGFEVTVGLFFFLCGLLLFLYFYRRQRVWFLLCAFLLFVLSFYTYNTFRVLGVLSCFVCFFAAYIRFPKQRMQILGVGILAFLAALPLLLFSFTSAGQARFTEVSIFSAHTPFLLYPLMYFATYLKYFSFSYLFSLGDTIGRHTVFRMGPLFKWEIISLLLGIYFLLKEKINFSRLCILVLLAISPLAAALALPSPHLLRSLPMIIPLTLLLSLGLIQLWTMRKIRYVVIGILCIVAFLESILYVDYYYYHSAVVLADWGGEYKELLTTLTTYENPTTILVVNTNVGMNDVYLKFYYPHLHLLYVDDSWTRPQTMMGKTVIYVTSAEAKQKNTYIHTYPHTLLHTITTPDIYHNALYTIWSI